MRNGILCTFLLSLITHFSFTQKVSIGPEPGWLYKIKPASDKKPGSKEISNGYYMDLVEKQTNLFTRTAYTHFVRHIVNETGVQNASEVSVNFSPEYESLIFHKIALIRNGVEIKNIKLSQIKVIQEESDAVDFQYNGEKRAYVILEDVRKEDRIDVSYSVVGVNPVFSDKYTGEFYFFSGVATNNYYQALIAPKNRVLNFKYFNDARTPKKIAKNDTVIYFWDNPKLKTYEEETNTPSWFTSYPYISVTEYSNWSEVTKWGLGLFNNYNYALSPALRSKVADLYKEAGSVPEKYIELATRFVQDQIRYLGMEIGAYTHKPHDPSKTFDLRYGDCKDKTLLLAMMLREKNIKAFAALANTNTRSDMIYQDPSPYKFNHVIVGIKNDDGIQYIDPTISYQRGDGAKFYIPAYGYVLILDNATTALSPVTPGHKQYEVREVFYVAKDNKEPSRLEVENVYEGGTADNNRYNLTSYSLSELEESNRKFYAKFYDSIQVDEEIRVKDDERDNKIYVSERYTIPRIWQPNSDGKKSSMGTYAHAIYDQLPNPATSYKNGPLALSYPQSIHQVIELHLPGKWTFPNDSYEISNESYRFTFKVIERDSVILLDYSFKTLKDCIDATAMARYKEDYNKIISLLEYTLPESGTTQSSGEGSVNWITVISGLVIAIVLFLLFRKYNAGSDESNWFRPGIKPGGWVIVLGITILLQPIVSIYTLFDNNYFSLAGWEYLGSIGGARLQWVLLIEEAGMLIIIGMACALCYWLIKRRDIFPRMFIVYAITKFSILLILCFCYAGISSLPESVQATNFKGLYQSLFYGLIWITYLKRSERVKDTFTEPYKPHENVKAEGEVIALPDSDTDSDREQLPEPGSSV